MIVFAIFLIRVFYIQIIKHDYYQQTALLGQFKEYQIPAERGVIQAHDGEEVVPIVLNQDVYTVFADPKYIENPDSASVQISGIIGGNASEYKDKMLADTRYSVLAKKIPKDKAESIDKLEIKGLGTRAVSERVYPQGQVAAQLLGFVDDDGNGKYGIEQYMDNQLRGKDGQLKAITDAQGVPLVANKDNVITEPQNGDRVTMTIDLSMQKRVEDALKSHLKEVRSESGSVVIMDPNFGAVKAMASYPTYNPAEFYKVEDASVFTNSAVSEPLEVGSVMKTLTVAAGLDSGAISPNSSYYDPSFIKVGNDIIRNVEEDGGAATRTVPDILRYSLNTGATWILMQMGGGEINETARTTWHDYLTDHFMFGKATGIEQGYEAEGYIPSPTDGYGLDITYANTAFGQAVNITPTQFLAAFNSTVNGGKYYQPHLLENDKKPEDYLVKKDVVKPELSPILRDMHEKSVAQNYFFLQREGYRIGGKTGTAEVPKPEGGGYYDDRFNGTFVGYVGGNEPEYVIMVTIKEPKIPGYAGREAAAPLFGKMVDMLLGNYAVTTIN